MEKEKELFFGGERSDAVRKQLEGRKMELMDGSRPALAGQSTKEA
jgi:hypothetical protein